MTGQQVMTPRDYRQYLENRGFKVLEVREDHPHGLFASVELDPTETRKLDQHCTRSVLTMRYDFSVVLSAQLLPEDAGDKLI